MSVCSTAWSVSFPVGADAFAMLTYSEILRAIQDCGADYVWIGMNAAGAYGSTVGSQDFDFLVRPKPLHLDKARRVFRALGMHESWSDATSNNLIAAGATDSFSDPYGGPSVDLMTEISGPDFEEVWSQHKLVEFSGLTIRIASLEHIIASKRAANREKDRYALKRLRQDLGREVRESRVAYRAGKKRK